MVSVVRSFTEDCSIVLGNYTRLRKKQMVLINIVGATETIDLLHGLFYLGGGYQSVSTFGSNYGSTGGGYGSTGGGEVSL